MKTIIATKELTNLIYLVKVTIDGVSIIREKPIDLKVYLKIGDFCQKVNFISLNIFCLEKIFKNII